MTEEPPKPAVAWPSDETTQSAFEAYALAVGKVCHSWNYLHEKLAQLYVVVSGADRDIALAGWYSTYNDRKQRDMLRAAVAACANDRWNTLPRAKDDIAWLLDSADDLADQRNNAVHAPCSLYIGAEGSAVMGAAFWHGHPRARKLMGTQLLDEFDWCERCAETLGIFTEKIQTGIAFSERYPWPERPSLPTRRGG